jgi:hypothetical protein
MWILANYWHGHSLVGNFQAITQKWETSYFSNFHSTWHYYMHHNNNNNNNSYNIFNWIMRFPKHLRRCERPFSPLKRPSLLVWRERNYRAPTFNYSSATSQLNLFVVVRVNSSLWEDGLASAQAGEPTSSRRHRWYRGGDTMPQRVNSDCCGTKTRDKNQNLDLYSDCLKCRNTSSRTLQVVPSTSLNALARIFATAFSPAPST